MEEKRRYGRQLEGAPPPLECPRCGSRNTKFCYYNNYNTAQPRHFCRECHRYWTQGGALRNIPAPGETSASRKRSRRATAVGPPTAPGPSSKVLRIRVDHHQVTSAGNTGMPGAALAALGMSSPPPPPPPMFFAEGMGLVGAGFPLRPTLSLFNQGFAGLRGFQPFNHLMMPPPQPPAPALSLPLLHGLGMNQVLSTVNNAGDGSTSGASGVTDDNINAGEGGHAQDHGNISGGDSFVNQFFTRFNESDAVRGDQARPVLHEFNNAADRSSNLSNVSATGTAATSTATGSPAPPASFI